MTKMLAINLKQPGDVDQFEYIDLPRPVPASDEVLIKVSAFGINRPDVMQRKGLYPPPPGASPLLGLEVAGTIISVGGAVDAFKLDDEVCALCNGGAYAEYVCVPVGQCLPIPHGLSMVEAASLPETFFTVYSNVFMSAGLKKGEVFLVHGGSSGIGVTAIQLAKAVGCTVITTAGSDEKCRACEALGADLAINYRAEDFVAAVKDFLGQRRVDVILDMVGDDYVQRNMAISAMDGRIVNIAFLNGSNVTLDLMQVLIKRLVITGSTLRPKTSEQKAAIARELKKHVWPLLESGKIKPVIYETLDWSDISKAHKLMESSVHVGKIVISLEKK